VPAGAQKKKNDYTFRSIEIKRGEIGTDFPSTNSKE